VALLDGRSQRRHHADRVVRDVSDRGGQWLVFLPSAVALSAVGRIDRDQVEDYARARACRVEEVERWLAPNLGYEPGVAVAGERMTRHASLGAAARRQRSPQAARGAAGFFGVFRYSRRALQLVWETNRGCWRAGALTLVAGLLPAGVAWIGAQIVDAVVAGDERHARAGDRAALVLLEGLLVAALAATQRGLSLCQSLLRAQLGQRVNVMILEKALTLELQHFEDSEFYDKLTRARREASSRPLSLVMRTFGLAQNAISLLSFAALLVRFSPWTVVVLLLAGLPAFVAEAKFSGDAFRLFRWRSPETRMQIYLETVLAREDHAKEVKLFGLGARLLSAIATSSPAVSRGSRAVDPPRQLGLWLGLLATATLYGAYAWIALSTVRGASASAR
jgi:ATP-binding cassette, subfamily B, bacterial